MRALYDNVIVKELQRNGDTTPEGVILPETIKLQFEVGLVVDVGPGRVLPDGTMNKPMVAVGNVVAYPAGIGIAMTVQGQPCRWLSAGVFFAVLEEDALADEEETKH
jgi:co-chaperonin GroES (HSP10)